MTAAKSFLPLSAVLALLGTLTAPTLAFRATPAGRATRHTQQFKSKSTVVASPITTLLRMSDENNEQEYPKPNSQEQEMMDQALLEQQNRQGIGQNGQQSIPRQEASNQPRMDPLIASLTRIDEPIPSNVPMTNVPLLGEVPVDGSLGLLVPAAVISVLGFIFSIVVAFNARDSLVSELTKVDLPKMEYTPTKVVEGQCRGLCSSQEEDLDGLRNFMESISKKK